MSATFEATPALTELDEYAQSLQPHQRRKIYDIANQFLCIGVGIGLMDGIRSQLSASQGSAPKEDKQAEYMRYLQQKAAEVDAGLKLGEEPK
ncbi:MAG: hypothetical protein WC711_01135 [Candidatus Staskawiczbacteria bacterium]|jgi:hypothetical protein